MEPALKQVAVERVANVERLGIAAVEPLHARREILVRRFDDDVVVDSA